MKKKIAAVVLLMLLTVLMSIPAFAYEERVFDDAGLLSAEEITQINEQIDYIRNTYNCDVVVVTTNDSEGKSAMAYADDYYDYNGFGMGDGDDGILLSINMDIREYWMSTYGQAILWFSDNEIEGMKSTVQSALSSGNYGTGVLSWLDDVEYELENDDGSGYIIENNPFINALFILPKALFIGLILAVIIIIYLIKVCRTAVPPALANDYLDQNQTAIRKKEDVFLRTHTTSVKIQTQSSSGGRSGGGSSTHRSSSGRSHGGGGGHF